MEKLTADQINFIIFFFCIFLVITPGIISFIKGYESKKNKIIFDMIFIFEFFVACYIALFNNSITENLLNFINKSEFTVHIFYYFLILFIELLLPLLVFFL